MPVIEELWGGQLSALTFDPVTHRLLLEVTVLDAGTTSVFDVAFRGVTNLRFSNAIPLPWAYAEVTEVHASRVSTGAWTVEIVLWSEDAELVVECAGFDVHRRDL